MPEPNVDELLPSLMSDEELEERARFSIGTAGPTLNLYLDEIRHRQIVAAINNIGAQTSASADRLGDIAKSLGEIKVRLGQMKTKGEILGIDR